MEEEKAKLSANNQPESSKVTVTPLAKKRNKFKPPRAKAAVDEPLIEKVVKLKQTTFKKPVSKKHDHCESASQTIESTIPQNKIVFKRTQLTSEELEEIDVLRKELAQMDAEIDELRKEKQEHEQQLNEIIDSLHVYNDLKDAAQSIFGILAELDGTTTKEMYKRYNLELED